jgi:hypothetical protein
MARGETAETWEHVVGIQPEKPALISAGGVKDEMGEAEVEVGTDPFHMLVWI